jgi:hypothetical protein
VPDGVANVVHRYFGDDREVEDMVLKDMEDFVELADGSPPAAPTEGKTEGGYPPDQAHLGLGDYRPDDALSYSKIELMLQCGQVIFGLNLKKAPVRTVFRNPDSWRIESTDKEHAKKVQANLAIVFQTAIDEILTSWENGIAVGETKYHNISPNQIGLDGSGTWTALREIDFVYPGTITKINRTAKGRFNGFQQQTVVRGLVDVPRKQSLIITHDKRFRNIWGRSMFRNIYAVWYWYEVVWRCFLRFLERQGTPVVLMKAPQRGTVETEDGTLVRAMDHALVVGADIAKSNVAVLPSDRYEANNNEMWEAGYMSSDGGRHALFINALQELGTAILRGLLLADRVATQESSVGSYNIASVHYIMTRLDDERLLDHIVAQLNQYLIPMFGLFNIGANAPATWLTTEGLDIEEKQRLFQLIMKMADAKHPDLNRIDIARALEIENVPILDEEEFKKKEDERAEKAIDMQQKMAAAGGKEQFKPKDEKKTDTEKALEALGARQVYMTPGELKQIEEVTDLEFHDADF